MRERWEFSWPRGQELVLADQSDKLHKYLIVIRGSAKKQSRFDLWSFAFIYGDAL